MEYGRVSRIMSRKLNETILVFDSVQKNRIRLARKQKLETIQRKKQQQTGKRKQRNYTCAWNSINSFSKFFYSTIFRKLALGPCNPRILRVTGWVQIAISQSHDACAPGLRGHAPMDHHATYPRQWGSGGGGRARTERRQRRVDYFCEIVIN